MRNHNFYLKASVLGALVLTLFIVGFIYYTINSIDKNLLKTKISQSVSELLDAKCDVQDLSLHLYPLPHIAIEKIESISTKESHSYIAGNKVKIYPSFMSMIRADLENYHLVISDLYLKDINNTKITSLHSLNNYIFFITEKNFAMNQISITNIWNSEKPNHPIASQFNLRKLRRDMSIECNLANNIKISEAIQFYPSINSFSSSLKMQHPLFQFNISHRFTENNTTYGEFDVATYNLPQAVKVFAPIYKFPLLYAFKDRTSIHVKGKIKGDIEGTVLDRIVIKGDNIDGTGYCQKDEEQKNKYLLKVDINQINLDNLLAPEYDNVNLSEAQPILGEHVNELLFDINAHEALSRSFKLNNLIMKGVARNESLIINFCNSAYNNTGKLVLSGSVHDNGIRPKFKGAIELNGQNINQLAQSFYHGKLPDANNDYFYLKADLTATPKDISLSNYSLRTSGQNIQGNLSIKLVGEENLAIGTIYTGAFDINDPNVSTLTSIYQYFKSLGMDMDEQSYSRKFTYFRNFPIRLHLGINLHDIVAEGIKIQALKGLVNLAESKFKIDNLQIQTQDQFLDGDINIVSTDLKPIFYFNIKDGNLILQYDYNDVNQILTYLNNNFISEIASVNLSGNITKLNLSGLAIDNLNWYIDNKNGPLLIQKASCKTLGGEGAITGNIVFNPIKLNIAGALEHMNLGDINHHLQKPLFLKDGLLSVGGQIVTSGMNTEDLISNTRISGTFLGKDIEFEQLNLNDLIINLSSSNITLEKSRDLMASAVSSGTSIIEDLRGNYTYSNNSLDLTEIKGASLLFRLDAKAEYNTTSSFTDIAATFSFLPYGKNIAPQDVYLINMNMSAQGMVNQLSKNLKFRDNSDMEKLKRLMKGASSYSQ